MQKLSLPLAAGGTVTLLLSLGGLFGLSAVAAKASGSWPAKPRAGVTAHAASRESKQRPSLRARTHARCSTASTRRFSAHVSRRAARALPRCRAKARPPQSVLLRARASTIAGVLATPCTNTELTPAPGDLELVRAAVLCLINQARADHRELPLRLSPDLQLAAEAHSAEMVAEDYFEHVAPDGSTPVDRDADAGYIPSPLDGYVIGENIAWGTLRLSTPAAITAAWMASPAHRANILESAYRETGIGVSAAVPPSLGEGAPGGTYTQEFGVIIG